VKAELPYKVVGKGSQSMSRNW